MFHNRRYITLPFLIALLGAVGTSYFGYRAVDDLITNQRSEQGARVTVLELETLLRLAINAETGQRGFLITGMDRYLLPYRNSVSEMPKIVDDLRRDLSHDPAQLKRLESFERVRARKFAELAETIELRRTAGFEAAQKVVQTDAGRNLMLQMRADVAEMQRIENERLEARIADSVQSAASATVTILLAGFLNIGLLVLIFVNVQAHNRARKTATKQLEDSQNLLRSVVDGSPAMIFLKNREGRYILVNRAFETFMQIPAGRAIGKTPAELFPSDIIGQYEETVRQVIEKQQPVQFEQSFASPRNGDIRHFLAAVVPLHDRDNNLLGTCGVMSDITPLKTAESEVRLLNRTLEQRVAERTLQLEHANHELKEANNQLEAFSYTVAHDLRAPLRGIQGFAQAVAEDYHEKLDPTGQDYLQRIVKAAIRMESLIEDLLGFAKLARAELRTTRVEIANVLREAMANLAAIITETGANIAIVPPLPTVRANHAACVQVLQNLLSNALKFTRAGEAPDIRIRSEIRGGHARLWIEDNGIGIAPEQVERIFRPFERLHGQEEYLGTGIGLAIVGTATRRMDGACGVESTLGKGARFWIELPTANEARND